ETKIKPATPEAIFSCCDSLKSISAAAAKRRQIRRCPFSDDLFTIIERRTSLPSCASVPKQRRQKKVV
ncbi:hypothetical protein, partial [Neisseria mucosa]|uniref:hypothetical protein n=1 Tax=Neisseria mucosa TaxID=488 RepID=UPI001F3BA874